MIIGKLAIALTIIFAISVIILAAELLYVIYRRRSFQTQTRVDPSGPPEQNPDGSLTNDHHVIDVFKMLESTNGRNILCTIKEEDREELDSSRSSLVTEKVSIVTKHVSLQEFLEAEAAAERVGLKKVGDVSPYDSPLFFTPVGSPSRDDWEYVSPVTMGNSGVTRSCKI